MPCVFVGFEICYQLHSPPLPGLASSETMWKTHIKSRAILQCPTRWHGALWMRQTSGYSNIWPPVYETYFIKYSVTFFSIRAAKSSSFSQTKVSPVICS